MRRIRWKVETDDSDTETVVCESAEILDTYVRNLLESGAHRSYIKISVYEYTERVDGINPL